MSETDETEEKAKALLANYRATFESGPGEQVLLHLCESYWVARSLHQPGDPYTTAFCDGQRSVVLDILAKLVPEASLPQRILQDLDVFRGLTRALS